MGFNITWIAFHDLPLKEAALSLGLALTGQSDETFDFPVNGISTDQNWSIVIFNEQQIALAGAKTLKWLSTGRDIVVVHINETVMHQIATRWVDGNEVWTVEHDSSLDLDHLEAEGDLPSSFEEIREARLEEQKRDTETDHISDVPLELAQRITGFSHDVLAAEYFELE
jgi:hypothetical protein